MLDLTMRMSWEVTRTCQLHIPLDQVFEPLTVDSIPSTPRKDDQSDSKSSSKSGSPIDTAIRCCQDWKTCYKEVCTIINVKL